MKTRKRTVFMVVPLVAALAALVATADAGTARRDTPTKITISLRAQNHSGQSGTAVLTSNAPGTSFTVTIKMPNPHQPHNPAHIHNVTCAQYAHMTDFMARYATINDSLDDLSRGRSTSEVHAPLAKRTTGHFSINIHAPSGQYPVIACGDIPKR
jgi:hypothetical protein